MTRSDQGSATRLKDSGRASKSERLLAPSIEQVTAGLDRSEFVAFAHPFVHIHSGHVVGAELLARWDRGVAGILPPGAFLSQLEASGRVRELTDVMLTAAAGLLGSGRFVSVNLSDEDVVDPRLVERVDAVIGDADPTKLCLEVLESDLGEAVFDALHRLNKGGVQIAIDDFGTAFSSLARVIDLEVDIVKLDRSLVTGLNERPRAQVLVRGFVNTMHELGTVMLAEGVENAAELEHAARAGCDLIQGYLYGRPVPLADVYDRFRDPAPITVDEWLSYVAQ